MTRASRRYRVYGVVLEAPIAISCPDAGGHPPDICLRPGNTSTFEEVRRAPHFPDGPEQWFRCRRLDDGAIYLRWSGLFEFLISPDARLIEYHRLQKGTHEALATYLLGQVLSFSLVSLGYEPLHATAVVVDGEAIAFLGDCGYGKSTLGAAFLSRGCPLLTDDVLALDECEGRWVAHPGPRRLKLFPSVARQVLHRTSSDRLNPGTSKLVLPLSDTDAAPRAVPITALYVLADPVARGRPRPATVGIAPIGGQKAFLEIVRAAFNLIQVDRTRLANQFAIGTRLARDVPIRRLTYPRRLAVLNDVCDAVIADASGLRERRRRNGTAG